MPGVSVPLKRSMATIPVGEVERLPLAMLEMIALLAADFDPPGMGPHPAVGIAEVRRQIVEEAVAALLRRQHDREGRIARDVEAFHGVHLDGDTQRQRQILRTICGGL